MERYICLSWPGNDSSFVFNLFQSHNILAHPPVPVYSFIFHFSFMSPQTWEFFLALRTRIYAYSGFYSVVAGALGQPSHYYLRHLYALMCVWCVCDVCVMCVSMIMRAPSLKMDFPTPHPIENQLSQLTAWSTRPWYSLCEMMFPHNPFGVVLGHDWYLQPLRRRKAPTYSPTTHFQNNDQRYQNGRFDGNLIWLKLRKLRECAWTMRPRLYRGKECCNATSCGWDEWPLVCQN